MTEGAEMVRSYSYHMDGQPAAATSGGKRGKHSGNSLNALQKSMEFQTGYEYYFPWRHGLLFSVMRDSCLGAIQVATF